jgi:hypothetical protein
MSKEELEGEYDIVTGHLALILVKEEEEEEGEAE